MTTNNDSELDCSFTIMGAQNSTPSTSEASGTTTSSETTKTEGEKTKCKPCCACPETRKARDLCIVERGEEECADLIEAHKECMRKLGYVVG